MKRRKAISLESSKKLKSGEGSSSASDLDEGGKNI